VGLPGTALSESSSIISVVNTPELALPDDYPHLLAELKAQIRSAQWTAARVVNTALIELYWAIGKAILDRQKAEGWGARVIERLSDDLRAAYPDMSGLSRSNIKYMRQMAAAWPEPAIGPQAVGQLPWGHIRVLLDKLDEPDAVDRDVFRHVTAYDPLRRAGPGRLPTRGGIRPLPGPHHRESPPRCGLRLCRFAHTVPGRHAVLISTRRTESPMMC